MKIFLNKYAGLIVLTLLALSAIIFSVHSYVKDKVIYPDARTWISWVGDQTLSDGTSITHFFKPGAQSIHVSFTLNIHDSTQTPYFVLYFIPPGNGYTDISGYDYIELELEAHDQTPLNVPVRIQYAIPGYSVPDKPMSYVLVEGNINFAKGEKKYRLSLDEFVIPHWWWEFNANVSNSVKTPDYSKVTEIQICGSSDVIGTRQEFTVYGVSFGKRNYTSVVSMMLGLAALIGIIPQLRKILRSRKEEGKLGKVTDEDTKRLIGYIAETYHDSELTSESLQKILNLSEGKMTALLKAYANTTFKRYLNQVRIQEACRLLAETDRPVREIALAVGYSSVPHFNRVFKENRQCSPNQYRKNLSKNGKKKSAKPIM